MPSTATTNLTIGTILDLIGPLAQPHGSGKDEPAFEALLQPPVPRDRPSPAQCGPTERQSSPVQGSQPARDADESSFIDGHETPSEAVDDGPPASANPGADEDSSSVETGDDRRSEPALDAVASAHSFVSQSLAGIATAPILAAEASPVLADLPDETDVVEQHSAGPVGKSKGNVRRTGLAQVVAAAPAATEIPAESSAQDDRSSSTGTKHVQAAANDQLGAESTLADDSLQRQVAAAADNDRSGRTLVDDVASAEPATIEAALRKADSTGQQQPKDSRQADQHHTDSLSAIAAVQSAEGTASAPTHSNSPTVGALTATAPIADAAVTSTNSSPSPSISPGGQAQRSRLLAEFLAQPGGAAQRRGAIEVDATRLLSRVARAFAAAQERDGEVRLRLSPPELGALRLDIRVQDGALVAHLQTETDAARTAIVENLPALRERLAEQGVRIERFDVDLMQRHSSGTPNQSDGRQPDAPPAALRAATPPRRTVEPAPSSPSASASATATDGLNVII